MDRDFLLKTALPMAGAILLMLAFVGGFMHLYTTNTTRARDAFDAAMRSVSERLGIRYQAASEPNDWPGASGTYRDHDIALFVVSETESTMKTGLYIRFLKPIARDTLAKLKGRRQPIFRRKLRVKTDARASSAALSDEIATRLDKLLSAIFELEIDEAKLIIQLEKKGHNFFGYNMLPDVAQLLELTDAALALALELEQT